MIPAFFYHPIRVQKPLELEISEWQYCHLKIWNMGGAGIRNYWRLYWNQTPGATVAIRETTIELEPEKVVLIPSYSAFKINLTRPVNHFFIHFFPGSEFDVLRGEIHVLPCPELLHRLIAMDEQVENLNLLLYNLVVSLLAKLDITAQSASIPQIDARIVAAIKLMQTLNRRQCTNEKLCKKVGMSLSSFAHIFRAAIGISPQRYLNTLQMDHARRLLHDTDWSIEKIAASLGFANRYHFSTTFRHCCQISPGKFRKHVALENKSAEQAPKKN